MPNKNGSSFSPKQLRELATLTLLNDERLDNAMSLINHLIDGAIKRGDWTGPDASSRPSARAREQHNEISKAQRKRHWKSLGLD
jgi:hypothetical protein